ncbi:MAG: D-2-hydroxyacid dehydrogenase [Acidobacteria bacterium]|nr:D-2-hydroxyacid dehydrogenase [Acidobacteriota bacterium]
MSLTVLVFIHSAAIAWTIPRRAVERLRRAFPHHTVIHVEDEAAVVARIRDADVAFQSEFRPAMLEAAQRLRWIHSPAAGVGNMLFPDMVRSEVRITNSRGIHADPIAEHVVGAVVALRRKLPVAVRRQAEHVWAQNEIAGGTPIRLLRGQLMGIVGLGAIGSAIARAAAGLGLRVWAVRRRVNAERPAGVEKVFPPAGLPRVLAEADVIVLAAPLTAETRGIIGARELALMKPDAILVNVGRGKLVREAELADGLARHAIAGAALDVFEHEPLDPHSPLWDLPNVLITPHTSALRDDYWEAIVDLFADNLHRYERGEPLKNLVDKRAGY